MSAALAPHCWKATFLADPEYVMDFTSPNAFCALAITVFASCAIAFPHRYARQNAITASFFTTAAPLRQSTNAVHVYGLRLILSVMSRPVIPPEPVKTATYFLPWNFGAVDRI